MELGKGWALTRSIFLSNLAIMLALFPVFICSAAPVPPIIYVAGDGSGDFNCDGINDHEQINSALSYIINHPEFTTVYLKGPFKYHITDTVYIGSNTILEGDSTAVMKLGSNLQWPVGKAMIQQLKSTGEQNITIRGFEMDGNHDENQHRPRGQTYHNLMTLMNSNNITVNNMYMHDGHSDGLKVEHGSVKSTPTNIKFYNNRVERLGHDAMYCIRTTYVEAYNNTVISRTNSAIRVAFTNHVKIHDNVITATSYSGGPGIEIQNKSDGYVMDDLEIYNNLIYQTYGPGMWIFNYGPKNNIKSRSANVYVHHNTFLDTGTNKKINWVGGIVISGFDNTIIENNVFDGCYGAAVVHRVFDSTYEVPGSGYTTILRNNIIVNTRTHSLAGNGIGVYNLRSNDHSFNIQYNCLYNNPGGDYKNTPTPINDIHANPLFADQQNHDYHLKSKGGRWDKNNWMIDTVHSPCIDAGYPGSDYSKEPEANGGRINIGLYGNTPYASKSELRFDIIDSAGDGSYVRGTQQVKLRVDTNIIDASAGIKLKIDSVVISTINTTPFTFNWDTTQVTDGVHTLVAIGTDKQGKQISTQPRQVYVDNTPPTVQISAPANGAKVTEIVTITADVNDTNIAAVRFQASGLDIIDNTAPYSVEWDTRPFDDGAVTLTVTAKDMAENETSVSINVTIAHLYARPVVQIIAPVTGDVFTNEVEIRWTATDADSPLLTISLYYAPFDEQWQIIALNETNDSVYMWDTTSIKKGDLYKIKVCAVDEKGFMGNAISALFTIASFGDLVNHGPNPAASNVTFFLSNKVSGTLRVYDINGRLVWSTVVPLGTTHILWNLHNMSGVPLANGMYLYMLVDEKGRSSVIQQLVIAR